MSPAKTHIIARLQKDLLKFAGIKPLEQDLNLPSGLGFLKEHLPQAGFPLGAIHEFVCTSNESIAATGGFVSALLGTLMKKNAFTVWVSSRKTLFPPAFKLFGLEPDRIIFTQLHREKDLLWAVEEALKCNGLASVVCELPELSFTSSRRFQLAVEQSAVTGFILRIDPRKLEPTACMCRWQISSLASEVNGLPGVGFPKWNVELLKVRNGKPGAWQVEWAAGKFHLQNEVAVIEFEQQKKTG